MKSTRMTFWLTTMVGLLFAGNAFAATFVVDSTANEAEPSPGDGVCMTPSGVCTLVAAIQEAEQTAGLDVIDATGVSGKITVISNTIKTPVEMRGAGVTLEGLGQSYRWRGDGTVVSGFEFVGFSNIVLEGNGQTFAGNTIRDGSGLASVGTNNAIMGNRIFATNSFAAIDLLGNDNGIVDGNVIGFDETDAAAPGASSAGLSISKTSGISVASNTSHGYVAGFFLAEVSDSSFYKNRIGDFDGATGNGAAVYHGIWSRSGNNNIYDSNLTNGHTQNGIYFNNSTGDTVAGHVAHDNGDAGIKIEANSTVTVMNSSLEGNLKGIIAFGNNSRFRSNRITQNVDIGIDLGNNGVTANDHTDAFTNFPTLGTATGGSTFAVDGAFADAAAANSNVDIDFFSSDSCDPSGNGEGASAIGSITVTTDAAGDAAFSASFSTAVAAGKFVTATATGPNGTSEFSACATVIPGVQDVDVEFYKLNHWVLNTRSWKPLIGLFLGSDTVDVSDISLPSLRLGNAPAAIAIYGDINHDGHQDLIVGFIGRFCGATCGTTELELTGDIGTSSFTEVLGVRIVGCKGKAKGH